MAGIRDHKPGYIRRDKVEVVRHPRPEGMIATHGQYRHRELAAIGQQRIVVEAQKQPGDFNLRKDYLK